MFENLSVEQLQLYADTALPVATNILIGIAIQDRFHRCVESIMQRIMDERCDGGLGRELGERVLPQRVAHDHAPPALHRRELRHVLPQVRRQRQASAREPRGCPHCYVLRRLRAD